MIIYTSGTTGNPKGALHAHRVVLGHLPNVEMCHNFLPKPGDLMWTPADWAWIGGLINAPVRVLVSRHSAGRPSRAQIRAAGGDAMMADLAIRNVFLPPTALKLMRQAGVKNPGVKLRSIFTGGESLGGELLGWVRETFGIDAHEVFGQTECNLVIGSNSNLFPIRPGLDGQGDAGLRRPHRQRQGEELPRGSAASSACASPVRAP